MMKNVYWEEAEEEEEDRKDSGRINDSTIVACSVEDKAGEASFSLAAVRWGDSAGRRKTVKHWKGSVNNLDSRFP